jgi:hypothetical protein
MRRRRHVVTLLLTTTAFGVRILSRTIAIKISTLFPFELGFIRPVTVLLALVLLCGAGGGCRRRVTTVHLGDGRRLFTGCGLRRR